MSCSLDPVHLYCNFAKILVGRPEKSFLSELESNTCHRYASFAETCCAQMPVRISILDHIIIYLIAFAFLLNQLMSQFQGFNLMKSEHFTNLFPRCELLSRSGASVYSNLAKILVGRPEKSFLSELESSTRHRYASFAEICCICTNACQYLIIFDHL